MASLWQTLTISLCLGGLVKRMMGKEIKNHDNFKVLNHKHYYVAVIKFPDRKFTWKVTQCDKTGQTLAF